MFKKVKQAVNYASNSVKAFSSVKGAKEAILLLSTMIMASPAYADFSKATTLLTQFKVWLAGISVITITIAIMVAGYKIIFQGQTFREVTPILVGGILIGGASGIASLFSAS